MNIPTEPIGCIPRPRELLDALAGRDAGDPASAARDTAFAKIAARVRGTALAAEVPA